MPKFFYVQSKRHGSTTYLKGMNVRALAWTEDRKEMQKLTWGEGLITMRHIISLWVTGDCVQMEAELGMKEWKDTDGK